MGARWFLRRAQAMVWLASLATALVACQGTIPVPAGAQIVRVVVTPVEVRLEPDTVRAGDVYLMLDEPLPGSVVFVQGQDTAEGPAGSLGEDGLERLRRGDTFHTAQTGFEAGGCSPAQDVEHRGRMGPCGNVMKVPLSPGVYAVLGGPPEEQGPIGVLTVTP